MAARALVGLHIAAIVLLGVATVVRLPVWGLVDEARYTTTSRLWPRTPGFPTFKITDMQAALGLAQLERLDDFHAARRRNAARLYARLAPLEDRLVLPRALPRADPSWFGFPFTLREGGPDERRGLQLFLRERRIRQPAAAGRQPDPPARLPRPGPQDRRRPGGDRSDHRGRGVGRHYPGLSDVMVDWIVESIIDFMSQR